MQAARPEDPALETNRKLPPTLVVGATSDMAVMQEEIFGPLLPVMGYRDAKEPVAYINRHDRPLALYWFGTDTAARDEVLARTVSGGVTVNDCLFHFTQVNQPMGGVGASGSGAYHGEWGFRTLSKLKPVFYRSPFNRLADLYPPYGRRSRGWRSCCGSCRSGFSGRGANAPMQSFRDGASAPRPRARNCAPGNTSIPGSMLRIAPE